MSTRIPKYRKHKTGQALVQIKGRRIYLGKYGAPESKERYRRIIAELIEPSPTGLSRQPIKSGCDLTINELMVGYWEYVEQHYVKNGRASSEQSCIQTALRFVKQLYGHEPVASFGPLALKAVRDEMIRADHCRNLINSNVHRIRRMFRWGVENELVPAAVYQALKAVEGLKKVVVRHGNQSQLIPFRPKSLRPLCNISPRSLLR